MCTREVCNDAELRDEVQTAVKMDLVHLIVFPPDVRV